MGKNRISVMKVTLYIFFVCLLFPSEIYADISQNETNSEAGIEQVYVNLPEIYVYTRGLSAGSRECTAYLSSEKLEQKEVKKFSESDEGIYYYVLLDISNSIPSGYFENIKKGILELQTRMGPKDKLVLYTFGQDVSKVLDGTQSLDQTETVLSELKNADLRTSLFDAVDIATEDAKKIKPEDCSRRLILVISDGEDVAIGKKTNTEALKTLGDTGIPVYAFGIKDTNKENINQFGEFARSSGGGLRVFNQNEFGSTLKEFTDSLSTYEIIKFSTGDNISSNSKESFLLRFTDDQAVYSKEVMVNRWIEDTTIPTITEIVKDGEKDIRIKFKEPVLGASEPQSYQIVRRKRIGAGEAGSFLEMVNRVGNGPSFEDIAAAVTGVSKIDDVTYHLTMSENLVSGQYYITCHGITDVSMEKNQVITVGELLVTDGAEKEEQGTLLDRLKEAFDNWMWRGLLFLIALGVVVLAVFYARVQKKLSPKTEKDILDLPDDNTCFEEAEGLELIQEPDICIMVTGPDEEILQLLIKKDRCIIGGRGSFCELRFRDMGMSRKHFSIEWDGEWLYIKDLNTTNGTKVNKKLISGKTILEKEDQIAAGSTVLTIRW